MDAKMKAASQAQGAGKAVYWSGALFFIAYLAALAMAEWPQLPKVVQILVSLTPAPAFVWFLAAQTRIVRAGLDELEQRIQLEALAIAFPCSLALIMMLGLLQRVTQLNPNDWSYRHVWPIMVALYFLGVVVARWRYR